MLTSIFYYNLYRPYLVGQVRQPGSVVHKRERIPTTPPEAGRIYVLNKALKRDIVNYAQAVSYGVTDLRQSAKSTAVNMDEFNRTVHQEGFQYATRQLADGLDRFSEDFNKSAGFMQEQMISAGLQSFSNEISISIHTNQSRLSLLGLTLSDAGQLSFSRTQVESMSFEEINVAIGETISVFEGLRTFTKHLMTEPLIEHLKFKGLRYHYNYQMGIMETEGYSLIETGMIVDRRV